MKIIRFLPLAYMADTRGFFIFLAYAALVMGVAMLVHKRSLRRLAQTVDATGRESLRIGAGADTACSPLAGFPI